MIEILRIEIEEVVCDICNADYTDSDVSGGFVFGSSAVCPECAPKMLADINEFGEVDLIRAHCPKGKPFGKWIQENIRGGKPGCLTVTSLKEESPDED